MSNDVLQIAPMASVGVRELRQRASELLRRVEAGESIQITDRGRPVAVLAPLPEDPLERLRASGDLLPAEADLADLPEPLPLQPGAEPPSAVLARLRRDER
jgi:prevent-host-death family protein